MHVHLLQHSAHQRPARLADWLVSMGHSHTVFHLYAGELPPRPADGDALIVLDGPMGDLDATAPWLKGERKLIARALDGRKPLLGIGLGARLIAAELGARVGRGTFAEVGWHTVTRAPNSPFDLPARFTAFMWHREVFALPDGAQPLGGSAASPVQGFAWDAGRVVGLLCHLEVTPASLAAWLDAETPPAAGDHVQPPAALREAAAEGCAQLAPLLDRLLSQWLRPPAR